MEILGIIAGLFFVGIAGITTACALARLKHHEKSSQKTLMYNKHKKRFVIIKQFSDDYVLSCFRRSKNHER